MEYNIGIDVGSTTVKVVVTNNKNKVLYSDYKRHFSDTKKTIKEMLNDIINKYKNKKYKISMTGSGALTLSKYLDFSFVQEVIACKSAVQEITQNIDVAIELGGEDAKLIYFTNGIEERMNGSCAGGTGAFLDQMAVLLNTDTIGLNELAKNGETIYPIASRCGVFAKTDIQPLLNEGAKKEDIALSIMQAVVNQTISGLACGKAIKGNVIFLGGPLNYLDSLRDRFIKTLNLSDEEAIVPNDGHLFVALGATISNVNNKAIDYKTFEAKIKKLDDYKGNAFLGIDAGSTTAKLVLIDEKGNILYKDYRSNLGTPVDTVKEMILDMYKKINDNIIIRVSGSTGYGEALIKTALSLDISEIETMAHYRGAYEFVDSIDSIVDIGGQDMKYIKIKEDTVDTIMLNEACSSGCGSFIETLAKSLNISISDFVKYAIKSDKPVDLGSRCTVFMNSKIKQCQKEGATLGDIFAGLSYSVVKNALQKVMKIRNMDDLGNNIIVQGGTFLNDAVLRAFELITGKNVIRPNIAGLMGAYGVALLGIDTYKKYENKDLASTLLKENEILNLNTKIVNSRCQRCDNKCRLTISTFNNKKFISGNRCERGSGNNGSNNLLPNMYQYKYDRLFDYKRLEIEEAKRGVIGIPRVLNMYEDYPFWFTLLTNLGFRVIISDGSSKKLYNKGMDSIPSESVCYPAKLVHGHIINLIEKDIKTIFYPCIIYEKKEFDVGDNCYNCPIVQSYSEAIKLNVDDIEKKNINFINPFLPMKKDALYKVLINLKEFKQYNIKTKELKDALNKAYLEQNNFRKDIISKGKEFIKYLKEHDEKGIVLAGRPYHLDKEINHGIDTLINSLGLAVLSEDSICYESEIVSKLRVVDQWAYHSRIYHAADVVSKYDFLELVNLNSFGCGLDAIVTDQTEEILKYNNKLYTNIKIDEINNLGAIKIRLRSLIASMNKRTKESNYKPYNYQKNYFKKDMKDYTILLPDMSPFHMELLASAVNSEGYNFVCLKKTDEDMINNGLRYVNNDACYPSIIVIGQLLSALKSGKYDLNKTCVAISQTGGGCRATNYIGLIRKALKDAGLENIPILSFNLSGLEKDQGFKITMKMLNKLIMGVIYGDLLMKLLYQTRPYEKVNGSAEKLYRYYNNICICAVKRGNKNEFNRIVKDIIDAFNELKIKNTILPKVGVVGEILIKYHTFGNNNLVKKLEDEGMEVISPELMGFVKYCAYNNIIKSSILKEGKFVSFLSQDALAIISYYEKIEKKYLSKSRFRNIVNIYELSNNVQGIISTGNQTGEGWFLTAEIIELIKTDIKNIVCVQPFACLPNHIVGKAVIKKIRNIYPDSNIVPIDYDPGSSVSNQVNRIKLMISVAKDNLEKCSNK